MFTFNIFNPSGDLEEGFIRKLSDDGDAVCLYMGCAPAVTDANSSSTVKAQCPYRYVHPEIATVQHLNATRDLNFKLYSLSSFTARFCISIRLNSFLSSLD